MAAPRNEERNQEFFPIPLDHPQITANTTSFMWKAPAGRAFRIDRVLYANGTGLAADNANAFKLEVKNAALTVVEVFNTDGDDNPVGAAITTATIEKVASQLSNRVLAAGATLTAVFTEDGTATLPPGRLIVEGCLL